MFNDLNVSLPEDGERLLVIFSSHATLPHR
jgi:hypothetical protein